MTRCSSPNPNPALCRVVCFSPRHDLTLPELSQAEVEDVIRTWTDQTRELGALRFHQLRAGLREQGRDDGLLQSASAQPDLGRESSAQ